MSTLANAADAPAYLRCEYLVEPLCVEDAAPRLSWELRDGRRGAVQTAYQVQVASERGGEADLWDSGKAASAATAQVPYGGAPLESRQRCYWRVRTWDGDDVATPWSDWSFWCMGLLNAEDWQAGWIAEATPVPDARPAHNGYHSVFSESADAEQWVCIDLGEARAIDCVRLHPARPYDWAESPGFLFPVRYAVELSDSPGFEDAVRVADRLEADVPNPAMEPQVHRFPRQQARYVRLRVTRLAERDPGNHAFALMEMAVLDGEENVALGAAVTASSSLETGAWSASNLTNGDILAHPESQATAQPATMMRKEFRVAAPVDRAMVYVTAAGLYELRLNGERVGDHVLAPEWTDYRDRVLYQAYDVTNLVREGANALGAYLGDGWYAGRIGMSQMLAKRMRGVYGDKAALLVQLHITLVGGTEQVVVSNETWRATLDGPIRKSDMLDGEGYDARREQDGWDRPGFDAPGWSFVRPDDGPEGQVVAQRNEPLRIMEVLPARAVTEPKPGVYVFDLGQNMVGWARMRLRAAAGTHVTFRHAEMLNPDGTIYVQNLRGAPQVDTYWARGAADGEVYEPRFTYHGFRFVEVSGLPAAPAKEDLEGCVIYSGAPDTGTFSCSEAMLNRLWRNVVWTQRANQFSVPTDCPQRDERLGWQGDIQAFAQTAIFNMDVAAFLAKCIQDQRDGQLPDGRFADLAPHFCDPAEIFTGAPAWGDGGVLIPWDVYVNYGDRRMLAEHYEAARRWVDFIHRENPDLLWKNVRGNDYGDWLNSDTFESLDLPKVSGQAPKEIFATAFFARSAELVAKMAEVLGREDDAAAYATLHKGIVKAFQEAYVDSEGGIDGDTQAGYALALHFGLAPDLAAAQEHLVDALDRFDGRLSTGIQSTHRLMLELSRMGRHDLAYDLILQRDIPSWGFMIEQDATTIWERWDGFVPGRGFQNPGMNSFNHWAFGAVSEWMYSTILGLRPDPEAPGWAHFFVAPRPGGGLTHAEGSYRSIRGLVKVAWRLEDTELEVRLTAPANTSATVSLPTSDPASLREGGAAVSGARSEADGVTFDVAAGSYVFTVAR